MSSPGRRQNPTTTTTTTTSSTNISQNRSPRVSGHNQSSSGSSSNPLVFVTQDEAPRDSNTTVSEPFPSLPADSAASLQLRQIRTRDHQPLSTTVSRSSAAPSITTTSSQLRRRPIGIKRLSSQNLQSSTSRNTPTPENLEVPSAGRRRSTSAPQRPFAETGGPDGGPIRNTLTASGNLPALMEGQEMEARQSKDVPEGGASEQQDASESNTRPRRGSSRLRAVSDAAGRAVSRMSNRSDEPAQNHPSEYEDGIVDVLDVLDPEVSTLTTLTNVQNSLFVPDLGRLINRRPTYELTKGPSYASQRPPLASRKSKPLPPTPTPGPPPPKDQALSIPSDIEEESEYGKDRRSSLASLTSITSAVQEDHYAVLPHGMSLEGWSEEDKELLDDHVRHMLHSKREGFKRSMMAFGKYVRKPLGFFVTLYAFLITAFGLFWVLFLIGWVSAGARQSYIINIIDNVLVALFAIVGDGMAPFRAVDTYHMGYIAYYHHLNEKVRKTRELPKLQDPNDLPEKHETEVDVEAAVREGEAEFSVLTPEQQKKLEHHQEKFSKSHSFYKPHETNTHYAFPHHLFVAIVVLLDLHSCFQIALGACTWGISYHVRPGALTPTILSCSITVNILGGVLIKVGDNKTRKKDVLMRMFRQELTEEAMRRIHKDREREHKDHSKEEGQVLQEKSIREDTIQEESDRDSAHAAEHSSSEQHLKQ